MGVYKVFPSPSNDLYLVVRKGAPSAEPFWTMDALKDTKTENLTLDEAVELVKKLNSMKDEEIKKLKEGK